MGKPKCGRMVIQGSCVQKLKQVERPAVGEGIGKSDKNLQGQWQIGEQIYKNRVIVAFATLFPPLL
ncbi:MAG: hypothetical protein GXY32_00925 [Ruminococcaceae bacterium]|nr:hypothetical protein [Oscillospiraceae bacterium]